jgi:archaellum biogenesis ATPase FlaH
MAYNPDELASQLHPDQYTGGNGHRELSPLEYRRLIRDKVPAKLKGALTRSPESVSDRSKYIYNLTRRLMEEGIDNETIKTVMAQAPIVLDKFGGRNIPAELDREIENAARNGAALARKQKPKQAEEEPSVRKLLTVTADQVDSEETTWLWKNYIPFGEVTILGGRPGNGKSQLTFYFASAVTRASKALKLKTPSDVVIASLEDSLTKTIRPRLDAAKADLSRCHIVQGTAEEDARDLLSLPRDVESLFEFAESKRAKLIVIDPLSAALSGGKEYDSHRESDVRRVMAPIVDAAQQCDIAVLAVMHMKKKLEEEIMMTLSGSGAFPAVARSVLVFGYHPDQDSRDEDRVLVHAKTNLGPYMPPYDFRLIKTHARVKTKSGKTKMQEMRRVVPQGWSGIEAHELSATPKPQTKKTDAAEALLISKLQPGGKGVRVDKLTAWAEEEGISYRTLYRASKRLRVKRSGAAGRHTKSEWALP